MLAWKLISVHLGDKHNHGSILTKKFSTKEYHFPQSGHRNRAYLFQRSKIPLERLLCFHPTTTSAFFYLAIPTSSVYYENFSLSAFNFSNSFRLNIQFWHNRFYNNPSQQHSIWQALYWCVNYSLGVFKLTSFSLDNHTTIHNRLFNRHYNCKFFLGNHFFFNTQQTTTSSQGILNFVYGFLDFITHIVIQIMNCQQYDLFTIA